jgi:glycosyltransferase involved in cell wall biosynthesis
MASELPLALQVIPAFTVGGAEWMAAHLAVHLPAEQFRRGVVSLHGARGSPIEEYLAHHGVPVYYINKRRGFDPTTWLRLYRLLRTLQPTIVHTHQTVGRYVYPACWAARQTIVVHTVHNIALGEIASRFWRRFQGWAYRRGVLPVSIAQEVTRTFIEEYGRAPAAEIPNAIPTELYTPDTTRCAEWRSQHEVPQDALVFTCVAGLRPQKNHRLLLQAFAQAAPQLPDALLLLVGPPDRLDPAYAESLQRLAQELGLGQRVRFLGSCSDVPDILRASDVFVLSSDYEGNPLSVLEAMAAGLPVVSTAVGGVPELVQHGATGLLVPAGDARALAEAITQLGRDADQRAAMGHAARQTALERFDVRAMSRAYAALYQQLLPAHPTKRNARVSP